MFNKEIFKNSGDDYRNIRRQNLTIVKNKVDNIEDVIKKQHGRFLPGKKADTKIAAASTVAATLVIV